VVHVVEEVPGFTPLLLQVLQPTGMNQGDARKGDTREDIRLASQMCWGSKGKKARYKADARLAQERGFWASNHGLAQMPPCCMQLQQNTTSASTIAGCRHHTPKLLLLPRTPR
jgi:hypothetical protein